MRWKVIDLAEEDLQRAVAEYEVLRAELEALARQDELLRLSIEEHMRAKETMVRYQKGGKGAEILVPIGANSFLFAEVRDPDKALVGVGSDLSVEDTMENAIKRLERIIEELAAAAEGTAKKIAETSEKISEKSAIVRELYGRAQSQEG
jgi:prefoldin alpha subunit